MDPQKITRNCIVCGKGMLSLQTGKVRHAFDESVEDGMTFRMFDGNGSRIPSIRLESEEFDFFEIEICVCDSCLKEKRVLVKKLVPEEVVTAITHL